MQFVHGGSRSFEFEILIVAAVCSLIAIRSRWLAPPSAAQIIAVPHKRSDTLLWAMPRHARRICVRRARGRQRAYLVSPIHCRRQLH
jgi:hypothetical protein